MLQQSFKLGETAVTMFGTDKEPHFKANTTITVFSHQFRGEGTALLMFVQVAFSFVPCDNGIPHISADPLCNRTKHSFRISTCLHSQACVL